MMYEVSRGGLFFDEVQNQPLSTIDLLFVR